MTSMLTANRKIMNLKWLIIATFVLECCWLWEGIVVEATSTFTNDSTRAPTDEVAALPSGAGQSWNAIDACWRGAGRRWWADRKRLADCAIGFGRGTTGGKAGAMYVVTSNADDARNPRPGTLRYGVIQDGPLWITFARDMTITLANELVIASDKTIDGRGVQVHIANGPCLTIAYVTNVIVHGLHIHDCTPGRPGLVRSSPSRVSFRPASRGDAIHIFASRNVWIDHNSLSSSYDGLVDVTHASTLVTISNNFFSHHVKTMLLGHQDGFVADKVMRVTVAFNHFGPGLSQRMPRCRYGYFHVLNNDYDGWQVYAIGGTSNPTIVSEGNRFRATADALEVTYRLDTPKAQWQGWIWRSFGDTFLNGAFFVESGTSAKVDINLDATHNGPSPIRFAPYMTATAGALDCTINSDC